MKVTFWKSGDRRYGVLVKRDHAPDLIMNPAPGYDEFLPHDVLHFVAEAEWGLDGAVFGQLAAGGDAGTFVPTDKALIPKAMRQRRRRPKHYKGGRRSELLAEVLERAWKARHKRAALPEEWDVLLEQARAEPERVERIVDSLDDLAEQWHALRVGESLTLEWPRPERRRH
jgi:hypothetical protein